MAAWFPGRIFSVLVLCMLPGVSAAAAAPATGPSTEQLALLLEKFSENRAQLGNTRHVALLNYRQPSWEPRFYIIDPDTKQVLQRYVVAHGRGSDPDHDGYADRFSDRAESRKSSLGFFVTGDTYMSESRGHGLSMRLRGLSRTNRNAMERNIVIHANWYMEPDFLAERRVPGRSYGCLVFSDRDRNEVIEILKGGALIYAAY